MLLWALMLSLPLCGCWLPMVCYNLNLLEIIKFMQINVILCTAIKTLNWLTVELCTKKEWKKQTNKHNRIVNNMKIKESWTLSVQRARSALINWGERKIWMQESARKRNGNCNNCNLSGMNTFFCLIDFKSIYIAGDVMWLVFYVANGVCNTYID